MTPWVKLLECCHEQAAHRGDVVEASQEMAGRLVKQGKASVVNQNRVKADSRVEGRQGNSLVSIYLYQRADCSKNGTNEANNAISGTKSGLFEAQTGV